MKLKGWGKGVLNLRTGPIRPDTLELWILIDGRPNMWHKPRVSTRSHGSHVLTLCGRKMRNTGVSAVDHLRDEPWLQPQPRCKRCRIAT